MEYILFQDTMRLQTKLIVKKKLPPRLAEVGIPIALAGVTTLIGFLSFFGSYLTAITEFGIYTAIGVSFALLVAVTFIPAVISFFKNKYFN